MKTVHIENNQYLIKEVNPIQHDCEYVRNKFMEEGRPQCCYDALKINGDEITITEHTCTFLADEEFIKTEITLEDAKSAVYFQLYDSIPTIVDDYIATATYTDYIYRALDIGATLAVSAFPPPIYNGSTLSVGNSAGIGTNLI